jgi:hypothetical protein
VAAHSENGTFPARAKLINDAYISRSLGGALQELESLNATLSAAGQLRQLGDRPVVVLTAMKPYPPGMLKALKLTDEQGRQIQAVWKQMHDEEASWSHHTRHELVSDATHYIQFDRPDVVITAVREVVGDVRAGGATSETEAAKQP